MEQLKLATMIKRVNPNEPKADQFLFSLEPPYEYEFYSSETEGYENEYIHYVVCSSINNQFSDETLIFKSDPEGNITSWNELTGVRPNSTEEAMKRLGYRY